MPPRKNAPGGGEGGFGSGHELFQISCHEAIAGHGHRCQSPGLPRLEPQGIEIAQGVLGGKAST